MPDIRYATLDETADISAAGARAPRHVFITGLELIGSIGVYEHEKRYEQRIVVSLDLLVHDAYDGRSDSIADVYDYDIAIRAVKDTVGSGHFNLIETLAERIAERCLSDRSIRTVTVRIEKPDVLPACRAVGVAITRHRL
jgi:dihydroneopterin aldolase